MYCKYSNNLFKEIRKYIKYIVGAKILYVYAKIICLIFCISMCCLSWLHLVAQVEMQVIWDKRPVMSPEGVAKQEVTVFDLTVMPCIDSSSTPSYIVAILNSIEIMFFILYFYLLNGNKCFIKFGQVNRVENGYKKVKIKWGDPYSEFVLCI